MKKLFIISIFLCIMFFPKNTFALDYQVNGTTYQVDSEETFRDYIYYTFVNGTNYGQFLISKTINNQIYYVIIPKSSSDKIINDYNIGTKFRVVSDFTPTFSSYYALTFSNYQDTSNWNYYTNDWSNENYDNWLPSQNASRLVYYPTYYLSQNSVFTSFKEKSGNYTFEDITNKYVVEEPEEEKNMFDVVETFLVQFINILPFIIPFILVMNLICRMLFNERS